MKDKYLKPNVDIVNFTAEDVITTSGLDYETTSPETDGNWGDLIFK